MLVWNNSTEATCIKTGTYASLSYNVNRVYIVSSTFNLTLSYPILQQLLFVRGNSFIFHFLTGCSNFPKQGNCHRSPLYPIPHTHTDIPTHMHSYTDIYVINYHTHMYEDMRTFTHTH